MIRRLKAFACIAALTFIGFGREFYEDRQQLDQLNHQRDLLEKELNGIKKENRKLAEEAKKLQTDEYLMELARRDYFFSKDGEIIFHFGH